MDTRPGLASVRRLRRQQSRRRLFDRLHSKLCQARLLALFGWLGVIFFLLGIAFGWSIG